MAEETSWTRIEGEAWARLKADLAPLEEALGRRVLAAGERLRWVTPDGPQRDECGAPRGYWLHETGLRWEPQE